MNRPPRRYIYRPPPAAPLQTATDEPAALTVLEDLDNLPLQHISSHNLRKHRCDSAETSGQYQAGFQYAGYPLL